MHGQFEDPEAKPPGDQPNSTTDDPTGWGLEEGTEFHSGRHALSKIGGGSDYEAYLCWDDKMYCLLVAKCLRPHLVGVPSAMRAMEREGNLLLSLEHPVVVRGFDAVLDGDVPHLLMEHIEGPNLSSLLRRHGPLQMEQLLPLSLQICAALHYMASEKVLHLDVKPRNIIMSSPPRLIDLSVARSFDRASRITGLIGTDPYMAPEQCDPQRGTIGPAADVWGLGATLYHATTGRLPFPRPDYDKELHKDEPELRFPQLERGPDPFTKQTPNEVADIISRCLEPLPESRPSIAEIVGMLDPLVQQLPTRPVLRKMRPGSRRAWRR